MNAVSACQQCISVVGITNEKHMKEMSKKRNMHIANTTNMTLHYTTKPLQNKKLINHKRTTHALYV